MREKINKNEQQSLSKTVIFKVKSNCVLIWDWLQKFVQRDRLQSINS